MAHIKLFFSLLHKIDHHSLETLLLAVAISQIESYLKNGCSSEETICVYFSPEYTDRKITFSL